MSQFRDEARSNRLKHETGRACLSTLPRFAFMGLQDQASCISGLTVSPGPTPARSTATLTSVTPLASRLTKRLETILLIRSKKRLERLMVRLCSLSHRSAQRVLFERNLSDSLSIRSAVQSLAVCLREFAERLAILLAARSELLARLLPSCLLVFGQVEKLDQSGEASLATTPVFAPGAIFAALRLG